MYISGDIHRERALVTNGLRIRQKKQSNDATSALVPYGLIHC